MKKTEFYGVCVISKIGRDSIIGLACTSKVKKSLPKSKSRMIGDNVSTTYWFNTVTEAHEFYEKTWAKIEKKAV